MYAASILANTYVVDLNQHISISRRRREWRGFGREGKKGVRREGKEGVRREAGGRIRKLFMMYLLKQITKLN